MSAPRAEPVFFGPSERPLFGWLHRPAGSEVVPPLGVVLCNPFGYETVCAHRTLRTFAEAAANAGIPAMRFEYDGTGNSGGCDFDPRRLDAWIASIGVATDTLRRNTRCSRVVLLGMRLGSALAALSATRRNDIHGLISVVPIVSGKAYVRELRALQIATRLPEEAQTVPNLMEATGFVLCNETRTALSELNMLELPKAPAKNVLILDRNDLSGDERWARHLQSLGSTVDRRLLPGYVEMMTTPHSATLPNEMIQAAVGWLTEQSADLRGAEPGGQPVPDGADCTLRQSVLLDAPEAGGVPIEESLHFIDADRRLFGVTTFPRPKGTTTSETPGTSPRRGVLLLNAGATHHIGPNRLYVALARKLASLGNVVLRMDISGIGDSQPSPGEHENVVYTSSARSDIGQAVAYLTASANVDEHYAIGLCSGAYHALKAASGGVPLNAIVMINPLTFYWKAGMSLDAKLPDQRVISEAQRYQQVAFRMQSWVKLLRGGVDVSNVVHVLARRVASTVKHSARSIARQLHLPLPDDLGRELEALARRGISMQFIFSADDPGMQLLRMQGGKSVQKLGRDRKLDIKLIKGADHTFTPFMAREQLIALLIAALQQFPFV